MKWLFLLCLFVPLKIFDTRVDNTISVERCISAVVEMEASGENLAGKRAVMDVLLERMKRTGKPCHVVSLMPRQFSGFSWKKMIETKFSLTEFEAYSTMAPQCPNCTHFYSITVKNIPSWAGKFRFVKQINLHRFYREE